MEPSCPLGGKGTETFHQQAASAPRGRVCPGTNLPDGKHECCPAASKGSQPRTQGIGLPLWTRVPVSEWETLGLVIPLSGLACAAQKAAFAVPPGVGDRLVSEADHTGF